MFRFTEQEKKRKEQVCGKSKRGMRIRRRRDEKLKSHKMKVDISGWGCKD